MDIPQFHFSREEFVLENEEASDANVPVLCEGDIP